MSIDFFMLCFYAGAKIKHPALLYTPERIQQVKQQIVNDLKMAENWASIRRQQMNSYRKRITSRRITASEHLMTDEKNTLTN